MNRDRYQQMLIDLVLPEIKNKIPVNSNMILQQDGAKPNLCQIFVHASQTCS
jgi:hypothetical protein